MESILRPVLRGSVSWSDVFVDRLQADLVVTGCARKGVRCVRVVCHEQHDLRREHSAKALRQRYASKVVGAVGVHLHRGHEPANAAFDVRVRNRLRALSVPSNTSGHVVPSHDATAHTSIRPPAVIVALVVIFPDIKMSRYRLLVLTIASDSRPTSSVEDGPRDASVIVRSDAVP